MHNKPQDNVPIILCFLCNSRLVRLNVLFFEEENHALCFLPHRTELSTVKRKALPYLQVFLFNFFFFPSLKSLMMKQPCYEAIIKLLSKLSNIIDWLPRAGLQEVFLKRKLQNQKGTGANSKLGKRGISISSPTHTNL